MESWLWFFYAPHPFYTRHWNCSVRQILSFTLCVCPMDSQLLHDFPPDAWKMLHRFSSLNPWPFMPHSVPELEVQVYCSSAGSSAQRSTTRKQGVSRALFLSRATSKLPWVAGGCRTGFAHWKSARSRLLLLEATCIPRLIGPSLPARWNRASDASNPSPASLFCCCPLSEPSWREVSLLWRAQVIRLRTGGHLNFPNLHFLCLFCHETSQSRQQRSRGAWVPPPPPPQSLFPRLISQYYRAVFSCLHSSRLTGGSLSGWFFHLCHLLPLLF